MTAELVRLVPRPPPDVPDPVDRERWPLARVLAAGTVAVRALGACSDISQIS
jgi:hypothetical protein